MHSHRAKIHAIALGDSEHIPSQRPKASLKQQAETVRETRLLSGCQPFCYSVFLFSVLSSPTWTVGINLDFVHGAPKHRVYQTSLRSQCLGGTNKNKMQPADVRSKGEDRNVTMAVPTQRVEAHGRTIRLISQPLCGHAACS